MDEQPATRSTILGRAVGAGLSKWAADNLLRIADADGLMLRQGQGKRNEPFTYQCVLTSFQEEETRP